MESIRMNAKFIETSLERNFVSVLLGPRRVGKSHFMAEYQQKHLDRHWVFFNSRKN